MSRTRCRRCRLAILLAALMAWAPATAAAGLAPDRNGIIHACYGSQDGEELHITASRRGCPSGESPLAWNQRGRPGAGGRVTNWTFEFSLAGAASTTTTSSSSSSGGGGDSLWTWIEGAVPALGNALLLFGLGMLALSIMLVPIGWLLALPLRWPLLWRSPAFRWFGPALQIQPFDDSAIATRLGTAFALLTQARVGGGREAGMHLYLVTGEQSPGPALADVQGVPQTQALAAALSLLRLTWRRRRLLVSGSLMPADDGGAAAVAVSLRRNSKFLKDAELRPSDPPTADMTASTSNRVLAVAAAGWIEHTVVDETPGPPAREMFLSHDPRSWALFRAGAELSRISRLREAADHYERALAIDDKNIGALLDLAHLRRRDGYFEGAEMLAHNALELIEKRNAMYKNHDDDDPNWYRAMIVLATVHAMWTKVLEAESHQPEADRCREKAFDRAVRVAKATMKARDRLESTIDRKELERAAFGAKIPLGARLKARRRISEERRSLHPGWDVQLVQLHALLGRTFEPGALLLVARNSHERRQLPPCELDRELSADEDDLEPEESDSRFEQARSSARQELDLGDKLEPRPLIEYVRAVPLKSPRVLYNLACYYGRAAQPGTEHREAYLEIAFEQLRRSISRSAPLERRGLLEYARKDQDLDALRAARHPQIRRLWRLVPQEAQRR